MSNSKKRQAEDEVAAAAPKSKKKKSKFQEDDSLDMELGINSAIARMDNQLMADHLAQKTIRFGTELSTIELADLTISGSYIKDSSSFKEDRTLPNLPQFLEKFTEKPEILAKTPKANGAPHTIFVTSGGLRAANIVRALRKYQTKDCTVAKLFAKHMKVEEQTKFLRTKKTIIAVGTPLRLSELIDNGALSLENLVQVVVDASHVDQKKRGVMDSKDTMMPLARFLAKEQFKERYVDKNALSLFFY